MVVRGLARSFLDFLTMVRADDSDRIGHRDCLYQIGPRGDMHSDVGVYMAQFVTARERVWVSPDDLLLARPSIVPVRLSYR